MVSNQLLFLSLQLRGMGWRGITTLQTLDQIDHAQEVSTSFTSSAYSSVVVSLNLPA